eukprot:scaffold31_cov263-Pinguiococcus_pyrenoidosus.AAC.51
MLVLMQSQRTRGLRQSDRFSVAGSSADRLPRITPAALGTPCSREALGPAHARIRSVASRTTRWRGTRQISCSMN